MSKADLEGLAFKVVRPFHNNNISLQFQMEECHLLLTDQVDLVNSEGHRVVPNVSKPLPLRGPPGQVTIQTQYFINKDLEYLGSGDKGIRSGLSISKLKAAQYLDFGLKELVPSLWVESEQLTIMNRILDKLDHMVKDFKLFKYNLGMETRIWSEDDRRRNKEFMEVIERRLKIRRVFRSLESFNIRVIPKYHSEDGNPARANIKQALGSYKDGDVDGDTMFQQSQVHNRMLILDQQLCRNHESLSKGFNASANSDINFFLSMSK
ncbi:hypothetical protein Tco_0335619 [Tanacetum coccineum]